MSNRYPPAGWYPDSGRTRWWDGQRWTDEFLDQQPNARLRRPASTLPAWRTPPVAQKIERPFYQKKRFLIPAALVVMAIIGSTISEVEVEPATVDVAQFIGQTPDDAHNQLEDELDAEMTTEYDDLSPAGRDPNRYEDIIVAADRKIVSAAAPKIRFWTLRPAEVRWFKKHRKMPRVKVGAKCNMEHGAKTFGAVDDLTFVASRPGGRPGPLNTRIRENYDFASDQTRWPNTWAKPQRKSVGNRREAYDSTYPSRSVIQGQAPKAGKVLKEGQLMVVYCSSHDLEESPQSDDGIAVPPVPDSDDDSFDFPDRLCPTRFC